MPPTERLTIVEMHRAAHLLRSGGTVAFPTETVYGLGADALSAAAVEKIFVAKQRPHWDPLIVHIAEPGMLTQVVSGIDRVSQRLMDRFWPGPLTLLLPRSERLPDAVTAGRDLVGVRMPAHPVARELIRQAGVPVAAPSANTFGHISPTTAAHVLADLDGRIDAVLDGGGCAVGVESTVVEVVADGIIVYRPGGLGLGEMESLQHAGWVRVYEPPANEGRVPTHPEGSPAPGVGMRHYAPRARLVLIPGLRDEEFVRAGKPLAMVGESLVEAIDQAYDGRATVGVMLPESWNPSCAQLTYPWGGWRDGKMLAQRLYDGLRALDDAGASVIVCPVPTMPGIGDAIRDRLEKAARR